MDITTVIGLIFGVASLTIGFVLEGGKVGALFQLSAAFIVFGGTFGAVLVGLPLQQLKELPKIIKIAFAHKSLDPLQVIEDMVQLAMVARREGILALEEKIEGYEDEFFKNGIRMVVDGIEPDLVRSILETELSCIEERHEKGIAIFESAGGFSPTMGIIGTVMGLVEVLGSLQNVGQLGPKIAVAFIATLYGVSSANVVFFPIANKLRARSKEEILTRELMIEGILSIQAGENPTILAQKLKAFLAPNLREAKRANEVREEHVETTA